MTDLETRRSPRLIRATVLGAVLLTSLLSAGPATAAPPESWRDAENPSFAEAMLTLGGWVLGIIVVIVLLTYLPSMIRNNSGDRALTFSEKSEWFGGRRAGVDQQAEQPEGTGGASARW